MKKLLAGLIALIGFAPLGAKPVITIDDEAIDRDLFDYYYQKNNTNVTGTDITAAEYLDLFINFRLKVHDAYERGMDQEPSFQQEFEGYRSQVAAGYMTDSTAIQHYVREAYEHLKEEVEVAHILITIPNPSDTVEAWNKANEIRSLATPENFAQLADAHSDDPSKHTNHGFIGYITGGMVVYPFEEMAFNTPVGSISQPIRTQFGYHIIYVRNRRPSSGQVLVAHIFKSKPRFATDEQLDSLQRVMDHLYTLATMPGANFAQLADEHSEDRQNATQGGQLPWIGVGRTNPDFENTVFALKDTGSIAQINAPYGWHIVKLLDRRSAPTFDEVRGQLEMRIRMDERAARINKDFIDGLKRDYKFAVGRGDTIATFANEVLTREHLHAFVLEHNSGTDSVQAFIDNAILDYENRHLEDKYPDFGRLMQEYRDGILLFNISNQEVWERSTRDTVALAQFFQEHIENYAWPIPHYQGLVIYCADKATFKQAKKIAKVTGEKYLKTTLQNRFNNDSTALVRIEEGVFEPGKNMVVDATVYKRCEMPKEEAFPYAFISKGSYSKYPESYLPVQGMVISDYQDFLDSHWIEGLKRKYTVTIDPAFRESLNHK